MSSFISRLPKSKQAELRKEWNLMKDFLNESDKQAKIRDAKSRALRKRLKKYQ